MIIFLENYSALDGGIKNNNGRHRNQKCKNQHNIM